MNWNKKIGIIGGGQLGKMMIPEAKKLGLQVIILDPTHDCPCHGDCDEHLIKPFDDKNAIMELASKVDVITYEFEHIDSNILIQLEKQNKQVLPTANSLKIIQNKYSQKLHLKEAGIPIPDFRSITDSDAIEKALDEFGTPVILKTCFGGYDGRGNFLIKNHNDIKIALDTLGQENLMIEKFLDFEKEISILACRSLNGDVVVYPVAENIHKDNILIETFVPAEISEGAIAQATALAHKVMEAFDGIGMFCVEMFVMKDGSVYVNEVAPRPHNSGHYTIEACITSQFENHIRAILGLPLGSPALINPAVMLNLLGQENGVPVYNGIEKVLAYGNVKAHIYGKSVSSPKRKLGHITICSPSLEECKKISNHCKKYLELNYAPQ